MSDSLKAFDKVLADVQEIKDKGNFIPDCSTKEGYTASKDFVLKVTTPARTALAAAHKEAKAFYLEGGRMVDSKKNELMSMLEEIQAPHQEAYKAIDEEKKRVKAEKEAAVQNGFDTLKGFAQQALGQSSSFIESLIDECGCFDLDAGVYGKSLDAIAELQSKVAGQLTDAYSQALQFEEMQRRQAELEEKQAEMEAKELAQRAAQEAQERAERDAIMREQMRKDAEEAAKAETERLKLEAVQAEQRRVEQEKAAALAAEEAAKQAAINARLAAEVAAEKERQRQFAEQTRIKAEAEAREADKKHRGSISSQALDCLVAGGVDAEQARLVIKLIAARKVAHIQINY